MLNFLGVGAAFNFKYSNNCAYFIDDTDLCLIDCGERIFDKILQKKILHNIRNIYCIVTHLHSDHIGSLEPMMYYIHDTDINLKVFYPKPKRLKQLLILMGIDFDFEIYSDYSIIKNIKIEPVKQKHIFGSYGYFIYSKSQNFFYSGDTCVVNNRAINELKDKKIDYIYHEVTLNKNAKIHTHLTQLENKINFDLRKRVLLMHFSNDETIKQAQKSGFGICSEN